jgi:hypothetical protein
MRRINWLLPFIFLASIPISLAQVRVDVTDAFRTVGQWLSDIFSNEYATFGVTIIVLTILLRAIFAASLKKVKIFEGEGGTGINTFGNTIAWTLSMMASIGLFYVKGNRDVGTFVRNILGPSAIYAAIVSIIVLFWWFKGATGATKWALPLTGLASLLISNMVQWPMLASAGVFMLIIGLFWIVGSASRGRRPIGRGDVDRTRRADSHLADAINDDIRTLQRDNQVSGTSGPTALDAANTEGQATQLEEQAQRDEEKRIDDMIKATKATPSKESTSAFLQARERLGRDLMQDAQTIDRTNTKLKADLQALEKTRREIKEHLQRLEDADALAKKVEQKLETKNPEELQRINKHFGQSEEVHLKLLKRMVDELRDYQKVEGKIAGLEEKLEKKDEELVNIIKSIVAQLDPQYFTGTQDTAAKALQMARSLLAKKQRLIVDKESLVSDLRRSIRKAEEIKLDVSRMRQSMQALEQAIKRDEEELEREAGQEEYRILQEEEQARREKSQLRGLR